MQCPVAGAHLRQRAATDLARHFPAHAVTGWLGHSRAVAGDYCWRVTPNLLEAAATFERLAEQPAQQPHEMQGNKRK